MQGVEESIGNFAFQYRVLCLRLKPCTTEREIVQVILHNCNPQIVSILHSTVTSVGN